MIVRTFYSAVDPDDSDEVFRIFLEDVKPAYEEAPGCRGWSSSWARTRTSGG